MSVETMSRRWRRTMIVVLIGPALLKVAWDNIKDTGRDIWIDSRIELEQFGKWWRL